MIVEIPEDIHIEAGLLYMACVRRKVKWVIANTVDDLPLACAAMGWGALHGKGLLNAAHFQNKDHGNTAPISRDIPPEDKVCIIWNDEDRPIDPRGLGIRIWGWWIDHEWFDQMGRK